MIVCLCWAIPDRAVRAAIGAGASTLDDIASACAAGSGCGGCHALLLDLLSEAGRAVPGGVPA
jgi:bacterioferritin-associated ferredoxin